MSDLAGSMTFRLFVGLLRVLMPPLCPCCGQSGDLGRSICPECVRELNRTDPIRDDPPPGISRVSSCVPHSGVGRRLLAAYKFRGLTGLHPLLSGYMADLLGPIPEGLIVVPIPPSRLRTRFRGHDPVEPLAADLAAAAGSATLRTDLLVRRGAGRQRGRGRAGRLGRPPEIRSTPGAVLPPGCPAMLVDDVITTGATLATAARALRQIGAGSIEAITFTRRL